MDRKPAHEGRVRVELDRGQRPHVHDLGGHGVFPLVRFRRAAHQSEEFLDQFRSSQRFSEVNAAASRLPASPLVGIFQAGYVEIDAQVKAARQEGAGEVPGYRIEMSPFGGIKETGVGDKEMAEEGLNFFTNIKTVFIDYTAAKRKVNIY